MCAHQRKRSPRYFMSTWIGRPCLCLLRFPVHRQQMSSPLWLSLKWGCGWTVQRTLKFITLGFTFFIDLTLLSHSVGTGAKTKFQQKSWPRLEAWPGVERAWPPLWCLGMQVPSCEKVKDGPGYHAVVSHIFLREAKMKWLLSNLTLWFDLFIGI